MKKKWLLLCVTVIVSLILIYAGVSLSLNARVQAFSLSDYEDEIARFSDISQAKLGAIDDQASAKKHAQAVWTSVFGEAQKRPFRVFRDESSQVWLVVSAPPKSLFGSIKGGSAYILLRQSDGAVLAVWHGE